MRLLALDTTGQAACVAIMEDQKLLAEYTIHDAFTHSETLMPMIAEVMGRLSLSPEDLDYIACSEGPGSFTGLRIGAATAKGLAFGLSCPVVPVPTLDALAYTVFDTENIICPIMDARRQQVYTAFYGYKAGKLCRLTEPAAIPLEEVIAIGKEFGKTVIFLGDGIVVHGERLRQEEGFLLAPAHLRIQRGAAVAALAMDLIGEGKAIAPGDFIPTYLRLPQAERERLEKDGKQ